MQSRVQRLSHMLFHQLFPQQLDRRQLKNSSDPPAVENIFSTTWRGLVSQVARGAATHILYRRPVEWIERLSDRYRNSKCTSVVVFCPEKKIIFPEKNIWQVIGWRQCALDKQFWLQYIFLLFPIPHIWLFLMHCNAASVTEPAKANPPYTHMRLLQELHVLHTEACRKAIHGRGLLSRHHLLNHSSLNMHKSFKGNNGALFFFTTPSQLLHNFQSFNIRTNFGLFWDISFKHFLNHSSLNMHKTFNGNNGALFFFVRLQAIWKP